MERLFTGVKWLTTFGFLLSLTTHQIPWIMVCFFCSFLSLPSIIASDFEMGDHCQHHSGKYGYREYSFLLSPVSNLRRLAILDLLRHLPHHPPICGRGGETDVCKQCNLAYRWQRAWRDRFWLGIPFPSHVGNTLLKAVCSPRPLFRTRIKNKERRMTARIGWQETK